MTNQTISGVAVEQPLGRGRRRRGDYAACFAFTLVAMLQGYAALNAARDADWLAAAHYGVVAGALAICGVLTLIRGAVLARRSGWRARAIAVIGNFAIVPLAAIPLSWRPDWVMSVTTLGVVVAYCWVIWALLTLRRGFSVFPEARVLIMRGPYAIVRHPLYAAYIVVYGLVALPRVSVVTVLIAMLGIAAEVMRATNEEQVLRSAFPTYRDYAARVPAFLPRRNRKPMHDQTAPRTPHDETSDGGVLAA